MNPPKEITDVGLNMYVDTVKLRQLPLEVRDFDLENLEWHFDMPVWAKDGTDDWNLTPNDVINKKEGSATHFKRTMKSNISYPILVTNFKNKWIILDGVHRLTKLKILGKTKVKAKIVPEDFLHKDEFKTI